jgi:hypothetical protein
VQTRLATASCIRRSVTTSSAPSPNAWGCPCFEGTPAARALPCPWQQHCRPAVVGVSFRQLRGTSVKTDLVYSPTVGDEVEDLYELLKEVKVLEQPALAVCLLTSFLPCFLLSRCRPAFPQ